MIITAKKSHMANAFQMNVLSKTYLLRKSYENPNPVLYRRKKCRIVHRRKQGLHLYIDGRLISGDNLEKHSRFLKSLYHGCR